MKKYISLFLALVLLTGTLSGCLSSGDTNMNAQPSTTAPTTTVPTTAPTQPQATTIVPTQPTSTSAPEPLVYTWTDFAGIDIPWDDVHSEQYLWILDSVDDIAVLGDRLRFATEDGTTIADFLSQYDTPFFKENTLVVVFCLENYGPAKHELVEFTRKPDGTYYLEVKPLYEGFLCSPCESASLMVIEISGRFSQGSIIEVVGFRHP